MPHFANDTVWVILKASNHAGALPMTRPTLTRRTALASAGAALAVAGLPQNAAAQNNATSQSVGTDMRDRATRFLAMLDTPDRAARAFDDPLRLRWSFMHGSNTAPGLPLEDMTAPQKDAALDLLSTGLSAQGLKTAQNIMLQQDILRDELGKGSADRNRERFSVIIFGTPSATDFWGWRFEGHHLSLNYTLRGDEVVSVTPSSFSSEPNTVPSGPHAGLVVLPAETMGRDLFADLSDANKRSALINERSFGNILTTSGNEGRVAAPEGAPLGDLPQDQIDHVLQMLALFATDHLPAALAAPEQDLTARGDLMAARFAWAGDNIPEQSMYYRLHGDGFMIEFATLRNQPQHHHAIRHDRARNFAAHLL